MAYYIGDYEAEADNLGNVKKIHYLSGAVLIQETNQPDKFYYTYTDNQGSLIALTDASGNVVRKYAYDPWGARRNASDWTQKDNGSNLIVNRGYTGHEHLDAFGIINMNGRVYDPATGMFLSPDPHIQSPGDWVNYNRYSYCMGNPMRFTDPSGYVTNPFDPVGADGLTNTQWINNYWYEKASKDRSDGAMYDMSRFIQQMLQDRQTMADIANNYLPNGVNPSDVAVHFGGIDAVDVGRSLKDGYGMVIESLKGTDYAVFSKGSFDFEKHADGDMTPSDPSAYFMTASIWDRSNGGGGSGGGMGTLAITNFTVGATGTFAGAMEAGWKYSSNASQWSSANTIARSLEDTGFKVGARAIKNGLPKGLKATGKLLGYASGVITVAEVLVNSQVNASNLLDVAVTGASFIPVVGWAIGGGYFVADMVTRGVTGQSIGDHLNNAVGGSLYDWEW